MFTTLLWNNICMLKIFKTKSFLPRLHRAQLWSENKDFCLCICLASDWLKRKHPYRFSESDSMLSFSENPPECPTSVRQVLKALLNCWRNSTPFWCITSFWKLKIGNFRKMSLVIWHPAWVPWFSFISSQKDWYGRFVGKNIAKLIKKRLNQCFPFWSVSKESQEKLITLVTILCFSIHVKIHQACYVLICYHNNT